MNPDPNEFESLRKLMALARYERPFPGYFDQLPGRILARLESAEEESGLWPRLASIFVFRPAFAYALGLMFCGAFVTGLVYSSKVEQSATAMQPLPTEAWELAKPLGAFASQESRTFAPHVAGFDFASTNIATETRPSLFNGLDLRVAPVSFRP